MSEVWEERELTGNPGGVFQMQPEDSIKKIILACLPGWVGELDQQSIAEEVTKALLYNEWWCDLMEELGPEGRKEILNRLAKTSQAPPQDTAS